MKEKNDMTEDQVNTLLQTSFQGITASERAKRRAIDIQAATSAPARPRRWVYALATTMIVLALSFLAFIPKPSAAAAFKRVQDAISNVRTMQVSIYGNFRKSPEKPIQQIFYDNGSWLIHAQMQGKAYWSLVKGEHAYKWKEGSTEATIEPYTESIYGMKTGGTALDFVKSQNGFDGDNLKTSLNPNPDVNGRPTYLLIIERDVNAGTSSGTDRCEIVVDKATDLPVKTRVLNARRDGGTYITTFDFQFNLSFPANQFEPCGGNASIVRDLAKERKDLKALWATTSLGSAKGGAYECLVRDVTINPDGNILMAYSGAPGDFWGATPTFAPTTVTDSDGTIYLRIRDYGPGGLLSTEGDLTSEMTIDGHGLALCTWVALEPIHPSHDVNVKVGFLMRNYGRDVIEPKGNQKLVLLDLTAKRIATTYPDWSLALNVDYIQNQQPATEDTARADYYKAHKNFGRAGYWYKQAYAEESKVISVIAYRKLGPAIECFEKAGDAVAALSTKKLMLKDKAADTNLSEAERAKAAQELKTLG